MGDARRVRQFLRPQGYVPLGTPRTQAHLARWWRWYGLAAAVGLVVFILLLVVADVEAATFFGGFPLLFALYALGGWRVTHPPGRAPAD